MKKFFFLFLYFAFSITSYAQKTLPVDSLIYAINWDNCSESDLIFMYKDNIIQKSKEETFGESTVSKYTIKGIKVGKYTSPIAHIQVNKRTRRLVRISIIFEDIDIDWDKADLYFENSIKNIFGNKYKKTIDNYTNSIECIWDNYNEYGCKAYILLNPKIKTCAIAISPNS